MLTVALHLTRTQSGAQRTIEALPSAPVEYLRHLPDGRVAPVWLDLAALGERLTALASERSAAQALALGRKLRAALLLSEWASVEETLLKALKVGPATLLIRSNADELYALPWEAMPLGQNGAPLAEVKNLTVLYHETGVKTPLAPVDPPNAPLLAWSGSGSAVPHELVAQALGRSARRLAEPTLEQLVEALGSGAHDALVLLAHGVRAESGVALRWCAEPITPARLVAALRGLSRLPARVMVLACRGGAEPIDSLGYGGFALELHRLGVASVVASRWDLSFDGAVALAQGLGRSEVRDALKVGEVERLGVVAFGSGVTVPTRFRRALADYHAELGRRVEAMPWLSQQLGLARSLTEVCVQVEVREEAHLAEWRGTRGDSLATLSEVVGPARARWVMLGDPGSGKSTLLRHLALEVATVGEWLPVLLHAGELGRHESLEAAVKAVWGSSAAQLVAEWPRERLVVLVDGLDEVGEPREVRTRLLAQAAELGEATLIVAGRPEGAPEPWAGFGTLRLQPLTEPEQESLLTKLGVPEDLIKSQIPRLRAHSRLREMVGRPLLLTLAALVLREDGRLPNKRVLLYERAVGILLHRHELNLDVPRRVVRAPDDTLAALVALAPKLLREGEGPWARERCIALLREEGQVKARLAETWPTDPAASFLEESGRTLGLLSPQDGGRLYGFPHRSLGEYLASVRLVADPEARAAALREALQHPARWGEVLALTVSQLGSAEADALVRALVDAGEAGRGALYRVLASAEGLSSDTVRGVLKLEVGWEREKLEARQKVIEEIPALVKDLAVAVGLLDQITKSSTCGHDLFWVREVLRRIEHGEVAGGVFDGSVEDAKRAAKGAADNVLSHLDLGERAKLLALLQPWWRPIPAGSFDLGSNDHYYDQPIHRVTFTTGFQMLGVPVTWAMYRLFDPGHDAARETFGGKLPPEAQDEVPVYNVSWFASVMFAEWAGARLPLEPEWEYACRAGTRTRFWSGDTDEDLARVGWTDDARLSGKGNAQGHPHPVAQKPKNAWGLHDVHGNVYEWCADVFYDDDDDDAYDDEAYDARAEGLTVDPLRLTFAVGKAVPISAESADRGASRVMRGGSCYFRPEDARSACRSGLKPSFTRKNIGFRLLLCPPNLP